MEERIKKMLHKYSIYKDTIYIEYKTGTIKIPIPFTLGEVDMLDRMAVYTNHYDLIKQVCADARRAICLANPKALQEWKNQVKARQEEQVDEEAVYILKDIIGKVG